MAASKTLQPKLFSNYRSLCPYIGLCGVLQLVFTPRHVCTQRKIYREEMVIIFKNLPHYKQMQVTHAKCIKMTEQKTYTGISFISTHTTHLFGVFVPFCPELSFSLVHFSTRNLQQPDQQKVQCYATTILQCCALHLKRSICI